MSGRVRKWMAERLLTAAEDRAEQGDLTAIRHLAMSHPRPAARAMWESIYFGECDDLMWFLLGALADMDRPLDDEQDLIDFAAAGGE